MDHHVCYIGIIHYIHSYGSVSIFYETIHIMEVLIRGGFLIKGIDHLDFCLLCPFDCQQEFDILIHRLMQYYNNGCIFVLNVTQNAKLSIHRILAIITM